VAALRNAGFDSAEVQPAVALTADAASDRTARLAHILEASSR
jgi:hypothetical protein